MLGCELCRRGDKIRLTCGPSKRRLERPRHRKKLHPPLPLQRPEQHRGVGALVAPQRRDVSRERLTAALCKIGDSAKALRDDFCENQSLSARAPADRLKIEGRITKRESCWRGDLQDSGSTRFLRRGGALIAFAKSRSGWRRFSIAAVLVPPLPRVPAQLSSGEGAPHAFVRPFFPRGDAGFLSCFATTSNAASIARGCASWRAR